MADQFIGALGARISSLCGFELYRDRAGDFRYRLKAETGETLLVSAGHKDGLSAQEGIRSAWTCAAQEELYERRQTSSGKWIFNLRTPDGRVIGTSLAHDDEAARDRAMERMKAIFHAAS